MKTEIELVDHAYDSPDQMTEEEMEQFRMLYARANLIAMNAFKVYMEALGRLSPRLLYEYAVTFQGFHEGELFFLGRNKYDNMEVNFEFTLPVECLANKELCIQLAQQKIDEALKREEREKATWREAEERFRLVAEQDEQNTLRRLMKKHPEIVAEMQEEN